MFLKIPIKQPVSMFECMACCKRLLSHSIRGTPAKHSLLKDMPGARECPSRKPQDVGAILPALKGGRGSYQSTELLLECNNNNNNNNNRIQRRYSRFFTISSQRRELSPTRTLKWPGTCNTSSAYHVQVSCYVPLGTKGQLSY